MLRLSFRFKLLAAMMLTVAGVTGATLYVTQQRMQAIYDRLLARQFDAAVAATSADQEYRLGLVKEKTLALSDSVRLNAVMIDGDPRTQYQVAGDELRDVLDEEARGEGGSAPRRPLARGGGGPKGFRATFLLLLDADGNEILRPLAGNRRNRALPPNLSKHYAKLMASEQIQQVGYMPPPQADGRVIEMVFTKIIDPEFGDVTGACILGFPVKGMSPNNPEGEEGYLSGLWIQGELHTSNIPETMHQPLADMMRDRKENSAESGEFRGRFNGTLNGEPYMIFYKELNPEADFPPAFQMNLFPMKEQIASQQDLRMKIVSFGSLVLLGAFALSLLLARGLSGPIHELVAGTEEIRQGNYDVQIPVRSGDEIGQLTASFNEMAEGLAQNEKYRNVLSMVADKDVAEQLMSGSVDLGGELRNISVIFCDIRGFTAMTQDMAPTDVIALMNEHFTALTRVVYEHNGVVDKFVGDLIMAVFGAPKSYGNDVYNAARCALRMIEERNKINETATQKITVGIGLASGEAVAGCMGSSDRLNYTVMGARVNLASRLCSAAGRTEVVIDETTYQQLQEYISVETMDALTVKGFSQPVQAYKLTEIRSLRPASEQPETDSSEA